MLTQPEELKTLEQKIEDASNRITIMDKNYLRIQQLHASEEAAISQLQQTKADLTKNVNELDDTKKELTKEINLLVENRDNIHADIEKAKSVLIDISTRTDIAIKEANEKITSLKDLIQSTIDRENNVSNREEVVKQLENEVKNKHDAIKSFVDNL